MIKRTLVVHLGGIGDFILTCPVIQKLSEAGPVELLGVPRRLELAVAAGIAERVHDIEGPRYAELFAPGKPSCDMGEGFDRIVLWMRPDGGEAAKLRGPGGREVLSFPGLPPATWTQHATAYYLSCLGFEDTGPVSLSLPPSGEKCDVIVHPGSGGRKKNWPLDRFIVLADKLEASGRTVKWCLGPAEENLELGEGREIIRSESLVDVGKRLAAAKLYIGNDSGITHLAAAVGCPTVAIFGPTDPAIWGPRGDHVRIAADAGWPSVEKVAERAETL